MPFILGQHGLGLGRRNARIAAYKSKIPLPLQLPTDVGQIAGLLDQSSKHVYLLGSTALAAIAGTDLPYLNLLIDTKKLPELKQTLFDFGVTPVSTADLSANFVRFVHHDRAYNVLNMNFDTYVQANDFGMEKGFLLFAHNFLMYSMKDQYALDPYGALSGGADGSSARRKNANKITAQIRPLQQPKTLFQGFEHCLAATFDRALFGFQFSPEYQQIQDRLFHSKPGPEESAEITSLVLDYCPDLLEVGGVETASQLLLAPVCLAAANTAAGIDLSRIEGHLRRLQRQGKEANGREFMAAVHSELLKKPAGKGAAQGLPEYLASARKPFRRVEALTDALEAMQRSA